MHLLFSQTVTPVSTCNWWSHNVTKQFSYSLRFSGDFENSFSKNCDFALNSKQSKDTHLVTVKLLLLQYVLKLAYGKAAWKSAQYRFFSMLLFFANTKLRLIRFITRKQLISDWHMHRDVNNRLQFHIWEGTSKLLCSYFIEALGT